LARDNSGGFGRLGTIAGKETPRRSGDHFGPEEERRRGGEVVEMSVEERHRCLKDGIKNSRDC
jgi:hypothetical protein